MYLTGTHTHRSFRIKKLKDVYDCDLDVNDTVGAIFADEPPEKRVVQVEQCFGREISIPPTSTLRPFNARKRARADIGESSAHKRLRQLAADDWDSECRSALPVGNLNDEHHVPPVMPSIGEVADSNPVIGIPRTQDDGGVNGVSALDSTKSESHENTSSQLHAIPESNNSSRKGSPVLGCDVHSHNGNAGPMTGSVSLENDVDHDEGEQSASEDEVEPNPFTSSPRKRSPETTERPFSQSDKSTFNDNSVINQAEQRSDTPIKYSSQSEVASSDGAENTVLNAPEEMNKGLKTSHPVSLAKSPLEELGSDQQMDSPKVVKRVLSYPALNKKEVGRLSTQKYGNSSDKRPNVKDRSSVFSISSESSSNSEPRINTLDKAPSPHRKVQSSQSNAENGSSTKKGFSHAKSHRDSTTASNERSMTDSSSKLKRNTNPKQADTPRTSTIGTTAQPSSIKRAPSKWTNDEDEILVTAHNSGRSFDDISRNLLRFRTEGSCRSRYKRVAQQVSHRESMINPRRLKEFEKYAGKVRQPSVTTKTDKVGTGVLNRGSNRGSSKLRHQSITHDLQLGSENSRDNPIMLSDVEDSSAEEEEEDSDEEDGEEEEEEEEDKEMRNGKKSTMDSVQEAEQNIKERRLLDQSPYESSETNMLRKQSSAIQNLKAGRSQTRLRRYFDSADADEGKFDAQSQPATKHVFKVRDSLAKSKSSPLLGRHGKNHPDFGSVPQVEVNVVCLRVSDNQFDQVMLITP